MNTHFRALAFVAIAAMICSPIACGSTTPTKQKQPATDKVDLSCPGPGCDSQNAVNGPVTTESTSCGPGTGCDCTYQGSTFCGKCASQCTYCPQDTWCDADPCSGGCTFGFHCGNNPHQCPCSPNNNGGAFTFCSQDPNAPPSMACLYCPSGSLCGDDGLCHQATHKGCPNGYPVDCGNVCCPSDYSSCCADKTCGQDQNACGGSQTGGSCADNGKSCDSDPTVLGYKTQCSSSVSQAPCYCASAATYACFLAHGCYSEAGAATSATQSQLISGEATSCSQAAQLGTTCTSCK